MRGIECLMLLVVVAVVASPVQSSSSPSTAAGAQLSSARDQAAALHNQSVGGPFTSLCTAARQFGSNVMANCDSTVLPHDETAIMADPSTPKHLVAGSNDIELPPSGTSGSVKSVAGYYTSFDGGQSRTNGQLPAGGFTQTSDPAIGIDTHGQVFYAVIAFDLGSGGKALGGAIQVSTSTDGGLTFGAPVIVDEGMSGAHFEDKPYMTVDTDPGSRFRDSVYVTWTIFDMTSPGFVELQSPIFFSASRDGGQSWSQPIEISGVNPSLCTFSSTPLANDGRCREDQFSSPVVAPDGTIFVAFENDQAVNDDQLRNQYLVVKSSDGGATWSPPVRSSDILRDGMNDYPINVNGRQTLSNSQFRVNSAGNLAVDRATGKLYVVWSDNRHGTASATNTDVFFDASADGARWSTPQAISTAGGDQFYPWAAIGPQSTFTVSYFDRAYDPANSQYGITLARKSAIVNTFMLSRVDTGLSDPNHARWFATSSGQTTFLGDYNGLAVGSDGICSPLLDRHASRRQCAFGGRPH